MRSSRNEALDLQIDSSPTLLQLVGQWPAYVQVKVDSILDHLGLGHALEMDSRGYAFGIDHGVGVVSFTFSVFPGQVP